MADLQEYQQLKEDIENDIMVRLHPMLKELLEGQAEIRKKLNPMYEIFDSVSGWNKISIWILKGLMMIGGAILGLYGILEFIKKIGK